MDLSRTFDVNLGSLNIPFTYWQAGAIVVLLFLLVLTLAHVRHYLAKSSLQGGVVGIFFGFLIALFLEGFLIIGGKTAITEILGWKNAPKPITTAVDKGREKLVEVLGVTDEVPTSLASDYTAQEAITILQSLDPSEIKKVKSLICNP